MISYDLVQFWFVCWVEQLGSPTVDEISGAIRCYPEGAAYAGATDGAALLDVHRHHAIHKVVLAHGVTIGGEQRDYRLVWGALIYLLEDLFTARDGLR